jgi:predicted Zn-dependent peptidase
MNEFQSDVSESEDGDQMNHSSSTSGDINKWEKLEKTSWFQISLIVLGIAIYIPGKVIDQKQNDFRYEIGRVALCTLIGIFLIMYGLMEIWIVKGLGNKFKAFRHVQKRSKVDSLVSILFILLILFLFIYSAYEINRCFWVLGASFRFYPSSAGPIKSSFSKSGTLPNGLKYVLSNYAVKPRGYFSVALKVDVGSSTENERERGIAHFAEHMAFDASRKQLRRYGVWLSLDNHGVKANAFTTHRTTVYEVNDGKSPGNYNDGDGTITNEQAKAIHQTMLEQFLEGSLVSRHINIEKGAVIGENRMRNDTMAWIDHTAGCHFFGGKSLVCDRSPQGTDQTVAEFTVNDVKKFREKWYKTTRSTLYVGGDFEMDQMEKVVTEVWGSDKLKEVTVGSTYPATNKGAASGVYGTGEKRANTKDGKPINEILINGQYKGIDGIQFYLILSDPSRGDYHTIQNKQDMIENIHNSLFRYVFNHMGLEAIQTVLKESDLKDVDLDSSMDNNYQYAARVHEMKLKIGMGYGGEPAAQNINILQSRDASWRNVLFTTLVELRRLAMYGPHPALLAEAFDAYFEKITDEAADAGSKSGEEIVQQLYGDLSPNFTYYHPYETLKIEKNMLNNGMAHHAFNYIKGEASLMWKSWINLFQLNVTNVEEKLWLQKIQSSPRALLQVSHNGDLASSGTAYGEMFRISEKTLYLISDQVAKASLNPPDAPKGHVKSDDFLKKKDDDDFIERLRKRKYVKTNKKFEYMVENKNNNYVHQKSRSKDRYYNTRNENTYNFNPSFSYNSDGNDKPDMSDALPSGRKGHLLDYKRMEHQFDVAMNALKKTKPEAAKIVEERGAFTKAFEVKSGVKIFTLLNGIGVNMKELGTGKMQTPFGENGTAIIEIVSLGGKSVESTDLKGACDMFAMDVEDYMVAQYSRTGNVKVDQEMFPTALQNKAAKFRSRDKASVSQRIGTPGPPKGPMVNCDTEFLKIRAIISTSCPNDGLDKEPVPCSTDTIMDQDDVIGVLGDARLKMMPIFTARSVREAYGNMMEERMREKRSKKPRDIIKSKSIYSVLETAFPKDKRIRRAEPDDIKLLNPEKVSKWVNEQFLPDRIEINVVGDFSEKAVLMALQVMFGTLPVVPPKEKEKMKMVGYDIYSKDDVKYFQRKWPSNPSTNKVGCHLITDNVGRAFPTLMVPAQDKITFRGGEMRTIVSAMMEKVLWKKLRMDEGLTYFVGKDSFHSVLFPGFGFRFSDWGSGPYKPRNRGTDPLNVDFSIGQAKEAMGKDRIIGKDLYGIVMKALEGLYRTKLQSTEAWLNVLRGMSLKLPKAFEENGLNEPTLKDIDEAAVIEGFKSLKYEKYIKWMNDHVPDTSADGISFVIETVGAKGGSKYEETKTTEC